MFDSHAGFTLDTGFAADYLIILRNGFTAGPQFDVNFNSVGNTSAVESTSSIFGGSLTGSNASVGPSGLGVAFDNSNAAGVSDGTGAADQAAAAAVRPGIELAVPLVAIGNPGPGDCIKISAMINGSNHDYLTGCGDDHGDRFRKDRHRYPQRYEQPDDHGRAKRFDRDKDGSRYSDERVQQRPPVVRVQPPPTSPAAAPVPVVPPTPVTPAAPTVATETSYVVENRGLVDGAFAVPVIFDPTPGFVVSSPPPTPIDEIPPDRRPQGDDVAWIPGYWGWDDDRSDFIWVSGTWRNMPPDRQFVPGYWREVQGGYQWGSGFWQADRIETVQYLPPPPESLENGPGGQPSRPNHIWVPGVWVWRQTTYLWRPGSWIPPQDNWFWVPNHYLWTPSGCVFVNGYWDHIVPRRGVVFAPIHVPHRLRGQRTFVYPPNAVVNVSLLIGDLFARPRYDHFYFGDYYDRAFFRAGIYPVVSFHNSRHGYDPVFARYVATQRMAPDEFTRRLRDEYHYRRDDPEARPPRAHPTPPRLEARHDIDFRVTVQSEMVEPLSKVVKRQDLPFRFEPVSQDRIKRYRQTIAETR